MKERKLETREDLERMSRDVLMLEEYLPLRATIEKYEDIRSLPQNSRHWAMIKEFLKKINSTIEEVSDHTGFTPFEVKKIIAAEMPPEHIGILYAVDDKAIHKHLKLICNIPTSTRLNTKKFSEFDEILGSTIASIVGEINAVARKAM